MANAERLIALALAAACAACGPASERQTDTTVVDATFQCNERRVEYVVAGGFAASEAGVTVQCGDGGPRLIKWQVSDDGERDESNHPLTSDQFNELWDVIDGTGWRNLGKKCKNRGVAKVDPVYTIEVVDDAAKRTFTCQGKELPFPYDRFITELDVRAAAM